MAAPKKTILTLIIAVLGATGVNAIAFIGCLQVLPAIVTPQIGAQTTLSSCQSACQQAGYSFSYLSSVESLASRCTCSVAGPRARDFANSGQGTAGCAAGQIRVDRVVGTYVFEGCVARLQYNSTTEDRTTYQRASVNGCFEEGFGTANNAVAFNPALSTVFACIGSKPPSYIIIDELTNCSTNAGYIYRRVPGPAVSGHLRRRVSPINTGAYCPTDKVPCLLSSDDGPHAAYECLDVTTELESCGGCRFGVKGQVKKNFTPYFDPVYMEIITPEIQLARQPSRQSYAHLANKGVDCNEIEGAVLGSTTCQAGQCMITDCEDGYVLEDGTCREA